MDVSDYLSDASFWTPDLAFEPLIGGPFAPVASWLIATARPGMVVQVGLREPGVYFSACEAVRRLRLGAGCLLIDPIDDHAPIRPDDAVESIRAAHDRSFAAVSRRLSLHPGEAPESVEDGSVDLLLASTPEDLAAIRATLDRWRPKLSDAAVLVVPRTGVEGRKIGSRAAFLALAEGRPSFEFTHGDGLGLIALGCDVPPGLAPLFQADSIPARRDAIRRAYARLASGDRTGASPRAPFGIESGPEGRMALREELQMVREDLDRLEAAHRTVAGEHESLSRENPRLHHDLAHLRHHYFHAATQLDELRGSTAVKLIQRGRRVRERLFPQTRMHGRCLELSIRMARVAAAEGPRVAISRASKRLATKVGKALGRPVAATPQATPPVNSTPPPRRSRFRELPWKRVDAHEAAGRSTAGSFKILLVSHSACRTGAPLCLLRLAEELSKIPDVECWVVLRTGGDLVPEFARLAPTLGLWEVVEAGLATWEDAAGEIVDRFREYAPNGIAVCNTMAVSEIHRALDRRGVPVLSWIHELPTFIEILGGVEAINRIKSASRRMIVPADVVRESLITRFDVDPERVQTVRYGLEPKTLGLPREEMRERVREELKLPADARIVLGCGTIDMRKGADLFVQAARRFFADPAAAGTAEKTWFIWFGHTVDRDFFQWLRHDVEASGFADRILFAGSCPDMSPNFLAADVFALTSREDPCPFANLEAMEGALPVVAFAGSGGAPEVLGGGGVAVPYLDVAAMAATIRDLLSDADARSTMGESGRSIIRRSFTWPRFMSEFLGILREEYGYAPALNLKVSVIVPNYRHAAYLEERLRSVFEQTLRPHEIIFLDDCSPDDSVAVARRLAPESPVPMRIVLNEENSGSTFKQWMKGMDLATGDLIWLAESDDVADPRFLETLVPEFRDADVALAYSQSALIGPKSELWAPDFLGHTDDIDPDRWRARYTADAAEEAEIGLSQKNTIPNASAAVFRKPTEMDFAEELAGMRFAGDWLFYAMLLRGGKIAFAPESLNSYRRHEATVSFQSTKADTHAEETLHAKFRVFETFDVSLNAMARGMGQTLFEYDMLTERFGLKRPSLMNNVRAAGPLNRVRELMRRKHDAPGELRILLVLDSTEADLEAITTAHLANALAREHAVFVCHARPSREAEGLRSLFDDRVVLLEGTFDVTPWSADPAGRVRSTVLQEMIRFHEIDVIHSRGEAADRLVARINADLNVPWFVHIADGRDAWLDDVIQAANGRKIRPANRISGVFHDGPVDILESRPELASKRLTAVHPGLQPDFAVEGDRAISRREGEFLVFLIDQGDDAREAAMTAVRVLNRMASNERRGCRVRLVMAERPTDALALLAECDAALAPSDRPAGDTSCLVAAALACGLPVVAADSGPIHDLLTHDNRTAGIAVETSEDGLIDVDRISASLLRYLGDANLYESHRERARALFDARFHADRIATTCIEAYFHARDFLVFPSEARSSMAPKLSRDASRESA